MGCCDTRKTNVITPVKTGPSGGAPFEGPIKDRQCRDVLFLIIFLGFLGGLSFVIYYAIEHGDPDRMLYGTDSWGNVCNKENKPVKGMNMSGQDTKGKKKLFFFKKEEIKETAAKSAVTFSSSAVCVEECPDAIADVTAMKTFATSKGSKLCRYDVAVNSYFSGNSAGTDACPQTPVEKTSSKLNRCVPTSMTSVLDSIGEALTDILDNIDDNFTQKCGEDLEKSWEKIIYLTLISIGVSVVLTFLLRYLAKVIVYLVLVIMVLGTLVAIGFCWYSYIKKTTEFWLITAIVVTAVGLILLLILVVVFKRIALVVQLFKEAGKAIARMPQLFIQPFLTLLLLGGVCAGMVYIFLYIVTARDISVNSSGYVSWNNDENVKYLLIIYLLGFLWLTQFILACERLTISSAVAMWFFTRNKKDLSSPISKSIWRLIRYHLGSVAFGSLIIALVALVKTILGFIESQLSGAESPVAKFLLKCAVCCLWCFEKILKFLASQAYIQIAINGYGFCKAARVAFFVIVANALNVAVINSVGDFVLFLAKASTVVVTAVVGMELFRDEDDLHYEWLPITIACIGAYFIAGCFFGLYEMIIDAIFMCFVEDCDRNDGLEKPFFMSKGLMEFMNKAKKANRKKQEKKERKERKDDGDEDIEEIQA